MSFLALAATVTLVPSLAQSAADVRAPRAFFERADGSLDVRPLASLDLTDPRTLGARRVRFDAGVPQPTAGELVALDLAGGDIVVGPLRSAAEEELSIAIAERALLPVALEELRALRFEARIPSSWTAPLERASEGDRLFRLRGDTLERIDGGVEAFSAEGLRFHGELVGSLSIPWKEVAALFVEPLTEARPALSAGAVPIVVDLVLGSRLTARLLRIGPEGVRIARGAVEVELPHADVRELVVDDGQIVFLSALKPASAEPSRPFADDLGAVWAPHADRNVIGGPLTSGGRTWTRGFGAHAPSRIAWTIEPGFERFSGAVALDDSVLRLSARGSVRFRVFVDGRERFASPLLRGGDAPVRFSIALEGGREIALEADPADEAYVADRANWLDLVLARAGALSRPPSDQTPSERK